ncbi:MAG TPA: WD40 repeat domain-containing protein [Aggregatilinea sp.]|uniref:WD40 repeat domain-containing protein n=1 Tax=Aggregatilinea sp. TaxID=2806333 RepID=UPI002CC2261A|nr:WD40 repeat domain-containing protein [Aggregatilinea sp.]HML24260.1 WD40 repeat domain-containing protein [Aggregatilinea sp.]
MNVRLRGPARLLAVLLAVLAVVFLIVPAPSTTLSTGITRRGAAQIRQVGMLGEGGLLDAAWSPDGGTLALASTAGVWLHDAADLAAAPRLLDDPLRIVVTVAFSPAGDLLAAGDEDGSIWLWDTATWQVQRVLTMSGAARDYDRTLCFSPDGRFLAEGRSSGVRLWDVARGEQAAWLPKRGEYVYGIAFNPDGDLLAVSDEDGARVWSVPDGTALTDLTPASSPALDAVTFSPDGRYLLLSNAAWEYTRFRDFRRLNEDEHAALLAEPALAAYFGFDGYAFREGQIQPVQTSLRAWSALLARSDLAAQDWFGISRFPSPDGDRIVMGLNDVWEVWRIDPAAREVTLRSDLNGVSALALSGDARRLIATTEYAAYVWDLDQGTRRVLDLHDAGGHLPYVFWRDGQALGLFVDWVGGARLLDLGSGAALLAFDGIAVSDKMVLSVDSSFFAARRLDGSTAVWDLRTGALVASLMPADPVFPYLPLAFSADNRTLVTAQLDQACACHTIAQWDVATGTQVVLGELAHFAYDAQFSADGSLLAVGGGGLQPDTGGRDSVMQSDLRVWDVATGEIVGDYSAVFNSLIFTVTISPNARYAAAVSYADVWLWDLYAAPGDALRLALVAQGESDEYVSAAFNATGDLLVVGTASGTILLFDVRNGGQVAALDGHTSRVKTLHFSTDGRMMVSGAQDGTVRLWRADGQSADGVTRTELAAPEPVPATPTLTPPPPEG